MRACWGLWLSRVVNAPKPQAVLPRAYHCGPLLPCPLRIIQMMVEACFQGNSTDPRVKTMQVFVGLAATLPASIIIPAAFAASATPPGDRYCHVFRKVNCLKHPVCLMVDIVCRRPVVSGSQCLAHNGSRRSRNKNESLMRHPNLLQPPTLCPFLSFPSLPVFLSLARVLSISVGVVASVTVNHDWQEVNLSGEVAKKFVYA